MTEDFGVGWIDLTSWSDSAPGLSVGLAYDGDGRRVSKTSSAGTTYYLYDPAGNLAAEVGGAAVTASSTAYLTTDHPGVGAAGDGWVARVCGGA